MESGKDQYPKNLRLRCRKFLLMYQLWETLVMMSWHVCESSLISPFDITSKPAWCLAATNIEERVDCSSSFCLTHNLNLALVQQTKNNVAYISRDYTCNVTQCKVASQRERKNLNFNLVRFATTSCFDNKEETLLNRLSLAEWQTQPWQNKWVWGDRHHLLEAM